MPRQRINGFTVIELLTVTAIIAVLISLLLPGISRARNQAKTVKCSSNLRQLGLSFQMYATDWNDIIMPIGDWNTANPDPNKVAPYWFERCADYFRFVARSKESTVDILRCPVAIEQLVPITSTWGKYQVKYGLNYDISTRGVPFRKFSSLQRTVVIAADGYAERSSNGTWGVIEGVNKDWIPWPFVYPALPGHNNQHMANMLFSDLQVELRKTNPSSKEWKD